MKNSRRSVLLATACLALSAAAPARAALIISEVMSQSVATGNTTGTPDWFELTNTGTTPLDLSNFYIDDSSAAFATSYPLNFPAGGASTLLPGQSEVFLESATNNNGSEIAAFRTFWGLSLAAPVGYYSGNGVGLSLNGDGVTIFKSNNDGAPGVGTGTVQAQVTFGVGRTGVSFDNSAGLSGTISTFSAVGVNGAYVSPDANANIGSPAAVPEPSAYICVGLASAIGLVALRRRRRLA